jgi:hypothetical protein
MYEKYICEEAKNGNCKIDCFHLEIHDFAEGFCNDEVECPEKDKKVKCVKVNMDDYI